MEGMLNDLSIGADTSKAFGEFVRTNADAKASLGKMEFSVQVPQTSVVYDVKLSAVSVSCSIYASMRDLMYHHHSFIVSFFLLLIFSSLPLT